MPSYDIEIRLIPGAGFEYTPPCPRIERGTKNATYNQITWTCKVGPAGNDEDPKAFAVHFCGASPCDKARYRTNRGSTLTAPLNTKLRGVCRYKYFVAVVDDNNNVWTDDPDMIVYD